LFYDLDPSLVGRGQLFCSVRRLVSAGCRQEDKGQCDKQDKNKSLHGSTLLYPFAPCRRISRRAAVRECLYTSRPGSAMPAMSPPSFHPAQAAGFSVFLFWIRTLPLALICALPVSRSSGGFAPREKPGASVPCTA